MTDITITTDLLVIEDSGQTVTFNNDGLVFVPEDDSVIVVPDSWVETVVVADGSTVVANQVEVVHVYGDGSGGTSGGIGDDAPVSSQVYGRRNNEWFPINLTSMPYLKDAFVYGELDTLGDFKDVAVGNSPTPNARFIRLEELLATGVLKIDNGNVVTTSIPHMDIPPIPEQLTAKMLLGNVQLTWTPAGQLYSNHGHTQVYRSVTTDRADATLLSTTTDNFSATDSTVVTDTTYAYWIRFVSTTGVVGPFNSTEATIPTAASDVGYLLDTLSGEIRQSHLHQDLNDIVDLVNNPLNGLIKQAQDNAQNLVNTYTQLNESIVAEQIARADAIIEEQVARATALVTLEQTTLTAITTEATQRAASILAEQEARAEALLNEVAIRNAGILLEATNRANALLGEAIARGAAISVVETHVQDVDESLQGHVETITAALGTNAAAIQAETVARTTAVSAEATQRNTLAAQMVGGYTGTDVNQVTTGIIFNERTARASADSAMASQIALLSAGNNNQFDYSEIWYFDASIESWTGNSTPVTGTVGWIKPANHATDPYIISPVISVSGQVYPQIRARIKKVGTHVWEGHCYYITSTDSVWNTAKRVTIAEPTYDSGVGLLTWNMSGVWATSTITGIRIDLSTTQDASNYFEIDWVAVGRPSPGASSAELIQEQLVRATMDGAMASDITTLQGDVQGKASALAVEALTIEVGVERGRITAEAVKTLALQVELPTKASASALSTLASSVSDDHGVLLSHSTSLTNIKASLSGGGNLLANSDFEVDSVGWMQIGSSYTIDSVNSGRDKLALLKNTHWYLVAGTSFSSTVGAGYANLAAGSNIATYVPVEQGARYCLSGYVAVTGQYRVLVIFSWRDAAGALISQSTATYSALTSVDLTTITDKSQCAQVFCIATPPATAVYVQSYFRLQLPGMGYGRMLVVEPMLEIISAEQTVPSKYRPSVKGMATATSALDARVLIEKGRVDAHTTQLNAIGTVVDGKGASGALQLLDSRVQTTEGSVAAQSTSITNLNSSVGKMEKLSWMRTYVVHSALTLPLLTSTGAALPTSFATAGSRSEFIATGVVTNTNSVTKTIARFYFDGLDWMVEQLFSLDQLGNHPVFLINNGVPSVRNNFVGASPAYATEVFMESALFGGAGSANATATALLKTRVTNTEGSISSVASDVVNLKALVGTSAAGAFKVLKALVEDTETGLVATASDVTDLKAVVGNAAAGALEALTTRVGDVEDVTDVESGKLTELTAEIKATSWTKLYAVNATTILPILEANGSALAIVTVVKKAVVTAGARRNLIVTGVTTATTSVTQTSARFYHDGTAWQVEQLSNLGTTSNHPIFLINNGMPSVKTSHASLYDVSVSTEDALFSGSAKAVQVLTSRVTSTELGITSQSDLITKLTAMVGPSSTANLAEASSTGTLMARVKSNKDSLDASVLDVNRLKTAIGLSESDSTSTLGSRVTQTEGTIQAQSLAITSLRAGLGGNGNLLPNSNFKTDLAGWLKATSAVSGGTLQYNVNAPFAVGDILPDVQYAYLSGTSTSSVSGTGYIDIRSNTSADYIPVLPALQYVNSVYVAADGAQDCSVITAWFTSTFASISNTTTYFTTVASLASVSDITDMTRISHVVTAPANAVYARMYYRIRGLPLANMKLVVAHPMFEEAYAGQTAPSNYTSKSTGVDNTASALDVLDSRVTSTEGVNTAQALSLINLNAVVGNAAAGAIQLLQTNVSTAQTTASNAATAASNAQGTANTALTNAGNAQSAANSANTALLNIASDNILSPSEKPSVVQDYTVIIGEQAGIDTQATAYSLTTEKTSYDTAVVALTTYLGTLAGWNTVPGSDVTIVGTTFRQKFADVYTTKQAVLNAIVAKSKLLADTAQGTANGAASLASSQANYLTQLTTQLNSSTVNKNPSFSWWSNAASAPDNWTLWGSFGFSKESSSLLVDGVSRLANNEVMYVTSTANASGIFTTITDVGNAEFLDITLVFTVTAGTDLSGAGILVDWNTSGSVYRTALILKDAYTVANSANWLNKKIIYKGRAIRPIEFTGTLTSYTVYLMANYNFDGLGALKAKTIKFDSLNINIADASAVALQNLDARVENTENGLVVQGSSITKLNAQITPSNVLDTSGWVLNSIGSQAGNPGWTENPSYGGGSNRISDSTMTGLVSPFGFNEPMWEGRTGSIATNASGGFNTAILADAIKKEMGCVFYCYFLHNGGTGGGARGNYYFGTSPNQVTDLNNAPNANPYFFIVDPNTLVAERWYLFYGVVQGYGSTASSSGLSGVYDFAAKTLVQAGVDFRAGITWNDSNPAFRAYHYYSSYVSRKNWWVRPTVVSLHTAPLPTELMNNNVKIPADATALETMSATVRDPITGLSAVSRKTITLESNLKGNKASVEANMAAIDGVTAQWSVRETINGITGGIGLYTNIVNGVPRVDCAIESDRFWLGRPNSSGILPFAYDAADDKILLNDVEINTANIGTLSVDSVIQNTATELYSSSTTVPTSYLGYYANNSVAQYKILHSIQLPSVVRPRRYMCNVGLSYTPNYTENSWVKMLLVQLPTTILTTSTSLGSGVASNIWSTSYTLSNATSTNNDVVPANYGLPINPGDTLVLTSSTGTILSVGKVSSSVFPPHEWVPVYPVGASNPNTNHFNLWVYTVHMEYILTFASGTVADMRLASGNLFTTVIAKDILTRNVAGIVNRMETALLPVITSAHNGKTTYLGVASHTGGAYNPTGTVNSDRDTSNGTVYLSSLDVMAVR